MCPYIIFSMTFVELRRKLNDSYVGQKVNGSVLGILFEGFNRAAFDMMKGGSYVAMGVIGYTVDKLSCNYTDLGGFANDLMLRDAISGGLQETLPQSHYSHTSRLYKPIIGANGILIVMERIPVITALRSKLESETEIQ